MAKKLLVPKEGEDYTILKGGVIRVNRMNTPPTELGDDGKKSPDYLSLVDHSLKIKSEKKYKKKLEKQEEKFNVLVRKLEKAQRAVIIVLQGRDGSGKSGAAERMWAALGHDPKIFLWVPIGPPTDDEKAHPYLWRFHTNDRMPRIGQARVFDRSWAERLLVEPVMGIIGPKTLQRSYAEIRTYEWLLTRQGAVVVKLWMDISKDEQAERFEDRKKDKPWKVSESDDIARAHWDKYTVAANKMFHYTGSVYAPWHIVSSEDKNYSRVNVLKIINRALGEALADGFKHNDK
jgi:AMP-polyphosphate phosphotransferase